MCGIAGVVAWNDRYRTSRAALARLSAAIAHRGPDGEGLWTNHQAEISPARPQAAFAHRRLAIIDPDPRADQPFTDGAGRWIVFNGEIYNFRELRHELTLLRPAYDWRTSCDTEVLLAAYAEWGAACVERLNGMFAFAVWDERAQSLYLARDRMGQKPLYVAYLSEGDARSTNYPPAGDEPGMPPPRLEAVAFASELSVLRQLAWFDDSTDRASLANYLRLGYVPGGRSIYNGAELLFPAKVQTLTRDRTDRQGYFLIDPPQRDGRPVVTDAANRTRQLLVQAVGRQLVSDVPIGCLLSGGIDSSVVASAMRAAGGDVRTFSIRFEDPRYDESAHAAAVAAHLGTRHHCFTVRPDAAADLPRLAAVFGEPFGDSSALPTHYLARETRAHVKVALGGDGGDELFGGYDRYRALRAGEALGVVPRPLRRLMFGCGSKLRGGHPKSLATRASRFLDAADLDTPERYEQFVRLFPEPLLRELLVEPFHPHFPIAEMMGTRTALPAVEAALQVDRLSYLPGDLLTKLDRASMLHALEVRSPFMDHELVRFAAGLSTDQLLRGGPKRMLREAFAGDLPAWVFTRKKMGFAVPIGDWLRAELRPMLRDHLFASDSFARGQFDMRVVERLLDEHETRRVDHSQRLYALLMLELWRGLQRGP